MGRGSRKIPPVINGKGNGSSRLRADTGTGQVRTPNPRQKFANPGRLGIERFHRRFPHFASAH